MRFEPCQSIARRLGERPESQTLVQRPLDADAPQAAFFTRGGTQTGMSDHGSTFYFSRKSAGHPGEFRVRAERRL